MKGLKMNKAIKCCLVVICSMVVLFIGAKYVGPKTSTPDVCKIFIRDTTIHVHSSLSNWQIMIMAIACLETGGGYDANAKNPKSSATGILQQIERYVSDCNRILGYEKYVFDDRYNLEKVVEMFEIIQGNYNKDRDVLKAIRLHSVGFAPENPNYTKQILRNIEIIENYEDFRRVILESEY